MQVDKRYFADESSETDILVYNGWINLLPIGSINHYEDFISVLIEDIRKVRKGDEQ